MCCFLPTPVKHDTVDFKSNDLGINIYVYLYRCMYGIVIVSLFYVFHLHFDDAQHAFHKREGAKTEIFCYSQDSRGSGLSKVSNFMSSR